MKHLLLVLIASVLCSCVQKKESTNALNAETFERIYVELMDSMATSQPPPTDTTLSPSALRILRRNGISVTQFKETVEYYNADTRRWKAFYENVVKRADGQNIKKVTQ